ncbi:hypothetical protein DM02DRAFT_211454 [Periconia macrospinosa]|uniref:Uncharacterized protein n=1 Tax=Periconia macrospinosa TaxID=97972 RepID=A0A2V1D6Y2_9PLEO|nr:hypothetical protein DM02DRAFT_211454 [Periconia macrospinosa]
MYTYMYRSSRSTQSSNPYITTTNPLAMHHFKSPLNNTNSSPAHHSKTLKHQPTNKNLFHLHTPSPHPHQNPLCTSRTLPTTHNPPPTIHQHTILIKRWAGHHFPNQHHHHHPTLHSYLTCTRARALSLFNTQASRGVHCKSLINPFPSIGGITTERYLPSTRGDLGREEEGEEEEEVPHARDGIWEVNGLRMCVK